MKNLIKNILKVLLLSIFIIVLYRIWNFFINANNNTTKNLPNNQNNFKNISNSEVWKTWVAITTNLGIKYSQKEPISQTIYQELFSIEELKKEKSNVENAIISKHMIAIKEYYSIIKTDFKSLIKSSNDKKKTFEWIYSQLVIRHKKASESIKILEQQKKVFVDEYNKLNSQIENVKNKLSLNYKKVDPQAVNEDISELLILRQDLNYVRTYIIFINNFLNNYINLNNYNWNLINALAINKEAIEKWAYVVLPNNWSNILKDYWLLYTEEEYKNMKNKEGMEN